MTNDQRFPGAGRSGLYDESEQVTPKPTTANRSSQLPDVAAGDVVVTDPASTGSSGGEDARTGGLSKAAAEHPRSFNLAEQPDEEHRTSDRARQGWRGWLNRSFGGMFRLGAGSVERSALESAVALDRDESVIRQSSWTRGVGILVANKKGTAGKTPTAICLGGILASIRGGSVAIVEASDDRGQLAYRSEGDPPLGIGELVSGLSGVATQSQLRGYSVTQRSFASVIGSTAHWRAPLDGDGVRGVAKIIDEHFTLRVWDTGNQYSSGAFVAAVETADVLVIPTMNSADSILDGLELLDFLRARDAHGRMLAESAIVVRLSDGRPESVKDSRVVGSFNQAGIPTERIYSVPFDAHIAERGPITLENLAPATRAAFTAVAAAAIRQANRNVHQKEN